MTPEQTVANWMREIAQKLESSEYALIEVMWEQPVGKLPVAPSETSWHYIYTGHGRLKAHWVDREQQRRFREQMPGEEVNL